MSTATYRIQIQSYTGGYLSTASITKVREYVKDFAREQAAIFTNWKEAHMDHFSDGILQVKDDDSKVLSSYRWKPSEGRWVHSRGAKITSLES